MSLLRRRPQVIPLELPRLDGSSWPQRRDLGRPSFAESTLYQLGTSEAFTPAAHDITDLLLARLCPALMPTEMAPEDEPYLLRVFFSAAQLGAGIGLMERRTVQHDEQVTDRQVAGALLAAVADLPAMPADKRAVAVYLMQCGYYLARTELDRIELLESTLPA